MSQVTADHLPGFSTRIKASLIDYSVILAWMIVIFVITGVRFLITGDLFNWLELGAIGAQGLGFVLLVLPVGLYLFACENSKYQATLGKRAMGLKVVTASGTKPGSMQLAGRTVIKLLPWEIAHFSMWHIVDLARKDPDFIWPKWLMCLLVLSNLLPVLYVACVAWHKQRRAPHDLLAGTRVISVR